MVYQGVDMPWGLFPKQLKTLLSFKYLIFLLSYFFLETVKFLIFCWQFDFLAVFKNMLSDTRIKIF